MILYVRNNEDTSHVKIIHFYEQEDGLPSELEANAKSKGFLLYKIFAWKADGLFFLSVLDESFPEITIDLVSFFTLPMHALSLMGLIIFLKDPRRWQFRACERRRPLSSSSHTTVVDVYDLSWCAVLLFSG